MSRWKILLTGCREIMHDLELSRVEDSPNILRRQIESLEKCLTTDPSAAFGYSKCIVETICKTILISRNEDASAINALDFMPLVGKTRDQLQLTFYSSKNDENVRNDINDMINGFNKILQSINSFRNREDYLGHGKDAFFKSIDMEHAIFAARTMDAALQFMYFIHKKYPHEKPQDEYAIYEASFNDYIDVTYEVFDIFDLSYKPSEILKSVDPDAYREKLIEYVENISED